MDLAAFARFHRRTLGIAFVLLLLWPSALAGAWTQLDTDFDGLSTEEEKRIGTDPIDGDSDGDGLEDGLEYHEGLDPLAQDSDGDTVLDLQELGMKADPLSLDSDKDTIPDAVEAHLANTDCDADRAKAIADPDDDGDSMPDSIEKEETRCDPDADNDTVVDGFELDPICVTLTDCDFDGLTDEVEADLGFDALNSDSYGMGMPDGLAKALSDLGLERSPDDDQDGIPDGWEGNNTLFPWHEFTPQKGRKDLFIEFVRVTTPATKKYDKILDFTPAYEKAAESLQRNGSIAVQWIETKIDLPSHDSPPIIPSVEGRYYSELLADTKFGTHPYVTTLVMNPEHDQAVVAHAGVAQIRGMLAAVDYGVHLYMEFVAHEDHYDYWCECSYTTTKALTLSPFVEALIKGGRDDLLSSIGYYSSSVRGNNFEMGDFSNDLEWTGPWFANGYVNEVGSDTYYFSKAELDQDQLADTIMHELGHTLGLCHLDLEECLEGIPANELVQTHRSTMDPARPTPPFDFLPSEWEKIDQFLACPPHDILKAISEDASKQELIVSKYAYDIAASDKYTGRSCGTAVIREGGLSPVESPATISTMSILIREQPDPYPWMSPLYLYGLPFFGTVAIIGWAIFGIRRKGMPQAATEEGIA